MSEPAPVFVEVNGDRHLLADDGGMLLTALRDELGLRGTRAGCGVGECGACTVHVDGRPTTSCDTPLAAVADRRVTTPEGLGTPDAPHAVQEAFLSLQAAQCGYCVNGVIMTVAALAADGAEPDDAELAAALDAHLCRCGTHPRLLQAARRALQAGGGSDRDDADPTGACRPGADPAGGGGAVTVGPCSAVSSCRVVRSPSATDGPATPRPPELDRAPDLADWFTVGADGRIELRSGRSEIGQGVHNAVAQIAASQLGIDHGLVDVRSASTAVSPDEDYTVKSVSVPQGGVAVAMAANALRRRLLAIAAEHLDADVDALTIEAAGAVRAPDGRMVTFARLAADGSPTGAILDTDAPRWDAPLLGGSPPRADLAGKLTGSGAYVQDLHLPGMCWARVLLPPTYDAELADLDTSPVEALAGVVAVVRDGRFAVVVADRDEVAVRGVESLAARARWHGVGLAFDGDAVTTMRSLPTHPHPVRDDPEVADILAEGAPHRATYTTAYQAHASMAPSCAVARVEDGHLEVWTSTQGVYPFRRELATLLEMDPGEITVHHAHGPGSYGHNGVDDVSALAAYTARAVPGRPVRLQYRTEDEFRWDAFGPAMAADLEAGLGDDGRIRAWRHRTLTDAHTARARGQGNALTVSWLRKDGVPRLWSGPGEGGARNITPTLYDLPAVATVADHVDGPLRTGSLRSLGAFANVFAAESFLDELAEAAGADPVAFRHRHLADERARAVLDTATRAADWRAHVGPSGRGQGVCLMRYHDVAAYVAVVADVTVDLDTDLVRVDRLVLAADAGTVVNTEGLRQQLEGGLVQGVSRTLVEQVAADGRGVSSLSWSTYPVIGFRDVPAIEVVLLDRPGSPPLGAGEVATPAVPAAVANAIDDAVGVRLRHIPFTPASIRSQLLALDDAGLRRVLA